jgi:hypothetical protein
MSQTTVKAEHKICFGSGKFEISTDGNTWTDVGAMRNIVFAETFDKVTVMSDNAGVIKEFIKNHFASLSGDLMELDLTNLNTIRGGIDTYSFANGVAETLSSGGKTELTAIQVKVTNTNAAGDIFRITLYKATNNKGIEISFQPDDADDPNMVSVELKGTCNTALTAGAQLFQIYNEQGEGAES